MKIVTLVENTSVSKSFKHQHGLSLYIETEQHKILFDTGANGLFIENAVKMGIDLETIDSLIISHGHYDHGGGLGKFLEINDSAKIYVGVGAFDTHAIKLFKSFRRNIGLDKKWIKSERLRFVNREYMIDEGLVLFNFVAGKALCPKGNTRLQKKGINKTFVQDDFEHEINLLISENNQNHLICGCAHKGILNIIDRSADFTAEPLDTVIGGFHLLGISPKNNEDRIYLLQLAQALRDKNVNKYYTCHCTGEENYQFLATEVNNIEYLRTGMTIEL